MRCLETYYDCPHPIDAELVMDTWSDTRYPSDNLEAWKTDFHKVP